MRFAFALFRYYPFGGLQGDTLRIALEAIRRGHDVTLFTTDWSGEPVTAGLRLRLLPRRGWSNHARIRRFAEDFARATAAEPFDLKVTFDRIPGGDLYFAADNCRAAKLASQHASLLSRLHPRYRQILALERAVITDPGTHIACIAERQIEEYKRFYQVPEERFSLLPPGIDPAFRAPDDREAAAARLRAEFGWENDALVLIQVGLGERKGTPTLLRALREVKRRGTPRPLRTLFVGPDHRGRMAALAVRFGLTAETRFAGPRHDVPELLTGADLTLHPAHDEAAGNVLPESIACGTPVLAAAACGFAPLVAHCGGELLPDSYDWHDLARRILAFAADPETPRRRLAERADCRDFHRRPTVFCDRMEELARRKAAR